MKKLLIAIGLFISASVSAQVQYGGVIRAQDNTGAVAPIKRTSDNLKVADSTLASRIPQLTLVGSGLKVDATNPNAVINATGSLTAVSQTTTLTLSGQSNTTFQLSGTWVATVQFEATNDNVTWTTIFAYRAGDLAPPAATVINSTNNDIYRCTTAGFGFVRAIVTAYTSGTIVITANATNTTSGVFLNFQLPVGTNTIGAVNINGTVPISIATNTPDVTDRSGRLLGTIANTAFTANAGTNLNTSALALDATLIGGNAKAIARSGAKGTTVAADVTSNPVDANTQALHVTLAGVQATVPVTIATNTPTLQAGSTTAVTQATAANLNATVVGNGTFATQISTALPTGANTIGAVNIAAAQTLATVTTVTAVTAITNALPTGANKIGTVDIATAPATIKGTQGANFLPTQDAKDAGRNPVHYYMLIPVLTSATDALQSLTGTKGGVTVLATATPAVVTTGKTFRVTRIAATYIATATSGYGLIRFRFNTAGVVAITSPVAATLAVGSSAPTTANATDTEEASLADGWEFAAGTGIGISVQGFAAVTGTAVGYILVSLTGYEY